MKRIWLPAVLLASPALAQDPGSPPSETAPPAAVVVPEPPQIRDCLIEVNGIAAKVNGRVITKKEVGMMLAPVINQLITQFPRRGSEFQRQLDESRDQILDDLIDREIIMSEFAKMEAQGANLPDRAVDQAIQQEVKNVYNGSEQALREELKKARMSMASYRDLTREKLIVQAMRQEHFKDAPPPLPGEVSAEYNEAKDGLRDTSKDVISYRKIFLPRLDPSNPLATPESQLILAEELAKEARVGADFAELARQHSQDAFAEDGGLQTDVPRPDLSPEFAAILFKAEKGEVLGPLEDPAGFTIAVIESIDKGPAPPLSEVRELIEERVRRKKTSERYEQWIERLRKVAIIDRKI